MILKFVIFQRLSITICLGKNSDIYLLDEPSAYIDIEDRLTVAKIIRRYAFMYNKTIFMVEHDIIMASSISDKVIVFTGNAGISCVASEPQYLEIGINNFLKSINITMITTSTNGRHRINKLNSQKDKEQKKCDKYYVIE